MNEGASFIPGLYLLQMLEIYVDYRRIAFRIPL